MFPHVGLRVKLRSSSLAAKAQTYRTILQPRFTAFLTLMIIFLTYNCSFFLEFFSQHFVFLEEYSSWMYLERL